MPVVQPRLVYDRGQRSAGGLFTTAADFGFKLLHRWRVSGDPKWSVFAVRGDRRGCGGWIVLGLDPEETRRWMAGDRWALGLRAVVPGKDSSQKGSLWIPTDASLDPSPPMIELRRGCDDGLIRVWLPDRGLIGWDAGETVGPADLVSIGAADSKRWTSPPPPAWVPERITSMTLVVAPEEPADGHSVVDSIRQDLGLPETPRPMVDPKEQPLSRKLSSWLRRQMHSNGPDVGGSAGDSDKHRGAITESGGTSDPGAGSMIDRAAASMTASLYEFLSRGLQKDRDEAIEKLMRMFRDDPDQALQHALPMGGGGAFRGLSNPGSALTRREVNFSIDRYNSGGGSADFWDLNPQQQIRLRQEYQRRAEEELAAGRYRRAAYIYAELIGDVRSAAEALRTGGHCREAAVLYRDRLKQLPQAAECFVEGRMFEDALAILTNLRLHRRAAEVCRSAGDDTAAVKHLEAEAESLIDRGQIAAAATVIAEELGSTDQAKTLLAQQYPMGRDVVASMRLLIGWIERDDGVQATIDYIDQIADPVRSTLLAQTATIMADAALSNADAKIRVAAADQCRLAAARTVRQGEQTDIGSVMADLRRITGDDDQWRRDINRFESQSSPDPRRVEKKSDVQFWQVDSQFNLCSDEVLAIESTDRWLVCLTKKADSTGKHTLQLLMCLADEPERRIERRLSGCGADWDHRSVWFEAMESRDETLTLAILGEFDGDVSKPIELAGMGMRVHVILSTKTDQTPIARPRTSNSTPEVTKDGKVVMGGGIVLDPTDKLDQDASPTDQSPDGAFSLTGLTSSRSLESPIWIVIRGEVFLCVDGRLWCSRDGGGLLIDGPVYDGTECSMAVAPRFTPPRLAIATDRGVSVVSIRKATVDRLADDEDCIDVAWINRRDIAILTGRQVVVYRWNLERYSRITTLTTKIRSPSRILPLGRSIFAVVDLSRTCQIEIYRPTSKSGT